MCAVGPTDADGSVSLADALVVAADPSRRTGRPSRVTWGAFLGLTLQAVAEHLCWHAADVPALQIPWETAPHRVYLPIYKADGEGKQKETGVEWEGNE